MNLGKILIFYSDKCSIFCVLTTAFVDRFVTLNRYGGHDDVCVNLILSFLLVNNLQQGSMTGVKCMANKIPLTIFMRARIHTHTHTQMNINSLFVVLR
jgi:hypothetical protein